MVTVGQAAVVTVVVAVSTGHPEGMAGGKGCSFWAVQWIGVIMLGWKVLAMIVSGETVKGD